MLLPCEPQQIKRRRTHVLRCSKSVLLSLTSDPDSGTCLCRDEPSLFVVQRTSERNDGGMDQNRLEIWELNEGPLNPVNLSSLCLHGLMVAMVTQSRKLLKSQPVCFWRIHWGCLQSKDIF